MACNVTSSYVSPDKFTAATVTGSTEILAASRPNHAFRITIEGSARPITLVAKPVGRRPGDILSVKLAIPAIAGFEIEFRSSADDGALILPEYLFPGQVLTSDGSTTSARFRFVYTGSVWWYADSSIPA